MKGYTSPKLVYRSMDAISPIPFKVSSKIQKKMGDLAEKITSRENKLEGIEPEALNMFYELSRVRTAYEVINGRNLYSMSDGIMRMILEAYEGDDFKTETQGAKASKLINQLQLLFYDVAHDWVVSILHEVSKEYPESKEPLRKWADSMHDITTGLSKGKT